MAARASGTTPVAAAIPALTPTITRQPRTAGPTKSNTAGGARAGTAGRTTKKRRRTPAETVALAERIKADRPGLTETALAAELGISVSRWRTVRRAAAESADHGLAA